MAKDRPQWLTDLSNGFKRHRQGRTGWMVELHRDRLRVISGELTQVAWTCNGCWRPVTGLAGYYQVPSLHSDLSSLMMGKQVLLLSPVPLL